MRPTPPTLTKATGTAEREAALVMLGRLEGRHRITLGADKNYDTRQFVSDLRGLNLTPHVAQNNNGRRSAIDARTTRHPGYGVSMRVRKRIEEAFGWIKASAASERPATKAPPGSNGCSRSPWLPAI